MRLPLRLVVLLSGEGSIFEAIVNAIHEKKLTAEIVCVISDNDKSYGLTRARNHYIATQIISPKNYPNKTAFQQALKDALLQLNPDLIVLSGFMRILSAELVETFPRRIVNIHPALLPKYPGLHTHERVLAAKEIEHGSTVHFVDAGLDTGPIIAQRKLSILPHDTIESLQQRVKQLEQQLYPEVLQWFYEGKV